MNIEFRGYREKVGLSQADVANMLGLSQAQVSRYEQSSESVPMGLAVKWLQILGVDLATAMSDVVLPCQGIDPGNPYSELYRRLSLISQYIDAAPPINTLGLPIQPPTPHDLRKQIKQYSRKPNLVLTGGFDAGKSHIANYLLGTQSLPTAYQPATKVMTFVRHMEDRPDWFKEDVWILGENFWLEDEHGQPIIDLLLLNDKERCEAYRLQAGTFDTLQQYGVHGGRETEIPAHSAVVYVDSQLLLSCNLIDLPGYADRPDEVSRDAGLANSGVKIADILIYTSPVIGHIDASDILRLNVLLRLLPAPENECDQFPTLGNLFIIATHAHPGVSALQVEDAINGGATRLYQESSNAFDRRREQTNRLITKDDVRKRFFPFWSETPERCKLLIEELKKTLGNSFPQSVMSRLDREIQAMKHDNKQQYSSLIESYEKMFNEIELNYEQLQEIEKNEPIRKKNSQNNRKKVSQKIDELKKDTKQSFHKEASKLINIEAIEQMIQNRYTNKKEAREYAPGYLVEQLQSTLELLIGSNSENLKAEIDNFLEGYTEAALDLPGRDRTAMSIPFDAQGAFLGGLAGLTTIGALSAWAAALGNLGGYILVAKLVSLLSALGIGFGFSGGTAGIIAFVATIGGPIVLGIGLAAALAFAVWGLFGESWQKRLAKKIFKYFQEQRVQEEFLEGADRFWQDTTKSFEKGADAVETKWQEHIKYLRELTSPETQSRERIEKIICTLEVLRDFFAGIPWSIST